MDNKKAVKAAPAARTDAKTIVGDRQKGDWKTKYPPEANRRIFVEATYLLVIIVCSVVFIFLVYAREDTLSYYVSAWAGGMLGGSLYAVKWLYSAVKDMEWLEDMWIWRFFTPIISGALGFAMVLIILSGIFTFLQPDSVKSFPGSFVVGFLTGYVTDSAVKKIKELAETLFGAKQTGAVQKPPTKK